MVEDRWKVPKIYVMFFEVGLPLLLIPLKPHFLRVIGQENGAQQATLDFKTGPAGSSLST